jgi:plasmid maintenance system antidote protein VapI
MASDLTKEEQEHVRAAMRFLRIRFGTLGTMAKALGFQSDTIRHAMNGTGAISPTTTFRISRLAGVDVDDLLVGRYPVKGMCPHCGRGPG